MRKVFGLKTMGAGLKFGKRTTLGEIIKKIKIHEKCICECGEIKYIQRGSLLSGRSTMCRSCARSQGIIHGFAKAQCDRFYKIRQGIKRRCNAKTCKAYKYYGGRGIKCERDSFETYKEDMYESYLKHIEEYGEKLTTIDRIDVNGNYCKKNCRRATIKEQNNNTRACEFFTFNGVTKNITQRAESINMNKGFVGYRLKKGKNIKFIIKLGKEKNVTHFTSYTKEYG